MKKLAIAAALLLWGAAAMAQDFQTGYFMDNYIYSYRLNPAFRPSRNFISLPIYGNTSVSLQGNVGLDSFVFPVSGDKLGTFMHPEVSAQQFLDGLKDKSKIALNASTNVIAFGFKTGPLYHFVDVNVRSTSGISAPYELFQFMKEGINSVLDIPDVKFDTQNFVEVAYGTNLKIGELISVGGRVKFLLGVAGANMNISKLHISESAGEWTVGAEGTLKGALDGLVVKTKDSADGTSHDVVDFEELDVDDVKGTSGFGAALDLGATFTPLPGLHLSASITDIGGISWKYGLNAETRNGTWTYNGNSEDAFDDLGNLMEFHQGSEKSSMKMLPVTGRIGAEFKPIPAVGVGLLATHRFGDIPWTEVRGSVTGNLFHVAEASVSAAYSDFGFSFGAALGLDLKAVNLFIGFDSIPTKFTPQFVPLGNANLGVTLGLNITFGGGKFIRI